MDKLGVEFDFFFIVSNFYLFCFDDGLEMIKFYVVRFCINCINFSYFCGYGFFVWVLYGMGFFWLVYLV